MIGLCWRLFCGGQTHLVATLAGIILFWSGFPTVRANEPVLLNPSEFTRFFDTCVGDDGLFLMEKPLEGNSVQCPFTCRDILWHMTYANLSAAKTQSETKMMPFLNKDQTEVFSGIRDGITYTAIRYRGNLVSAHHSEERPSEHPCQFFSENVNAANSLNVLSFCGFMPNRRADSSLCDLINFDIWNREQSAYRLKLTMFVFYCPSRVHDIMRNFEHRVSICRVIGSTSLVLAELEPYEKLSTLRHSPYCYIWWRFKTLNRLRFKALVRYGHDIERLLVGSGYEDGFIQTLAHGNSLGFLAYLLESDMGEGVVSNVVSNWLLDEYQKRCNRSKIHEFCGLINKEHHHEMVAETCKKILDNIIDEIAGCCEENMSNLELQTCRKMMRFATFQHITQSFENHQEHVRVFFGRYWQEFVHAWENRQEEEKTWLGLSSFIRHIPTEKYEDFIDTCMADRNAFPDRSYEGITLAIESLDKEAVGVPNFFCMWNLSWRNNSDYDHLLAPYCPICYFAMSLVLSLDSEKAFTIIYKGLLGYDSNMFITRLFLSDMFSDEQFNALADNAQFVAYIWKLLNLVSLDMRSFLDDSTSKGFERVLRILYKKCESKQMSEPQQSALSLSVWIVDRCVGLIMENADIPQCHALLNAAHRNALIGANNGLSIIRNLSPLFYEQMNLQTYGSLCDFFNSEFGRLPPFVWKIHLHKCMAPQNQTPSMMSICSVSRFEDAFASKDMTMDILSVFYSKCPDACNESLSTLHDDHKYLCYPKSSSYRAFVDSSEKLAFVKSRISQDQLWEYLNAFLNVAPSLETHHAPPPIAFATFGDPWPFLVASFRNNPAFQGYDQRSAKLMDLTGPIAAYPMTILILGENPFDGFEPFGLEISVPNISSHACSRLPMSLKSVAGTYVNRKYNYLYEKFCGIWDFLRREFSDEFYDIEFDWRNKAAVADAALKKPIGVLGEFLRKIYHSDTTLVDALLCVPGTNGNPRICDIFTEIVAYCECNGRVDIPVQLRKACASSSGRESATNC